MFIQQGKCMGSKSHLSDPQRSETSTIVVFGTYIIAILHLCISLSLFQSDEGKLFLAQKDKSQKNLCVDHLS